MSKTDKTRPYWVQLRDPDFPGVIKIHHWHNNLNECDLDFPTPVTRRNGQFRRCEYWSRWRDNDKIYGRPGYRRSYGSFQDRRARMELRKLRSKWKKETDLNEIDSTEDLPTQRWLWKRWYWD